MVPEAVLGYGLAGPAANPSASVEHGAAFLLASYLLPQKQSGSSEPSPCVLVTVACPMRPFLGFCPNPAVFLLKVIRRAHVLPQLSYRGSKFWQGQ